MITQQPCLCQYKECKWDLAGRLAGQLSWQQQSEAQTVSAPALSCTSHTADSLSSDTGCLVWNLVQFAVNTVLRVRERGITPVQAVTTEVILCLCGPVLEIYFRAVSDFDHFQRPCSLKVTWSVCEEMGHQRALKHRGCNQTCVWGFLSNVSATFDGIFMH